MTRLDRFLRLITGPIAVLALIGLASAQCPNDDVFEDNDDCASATVLPMGTTTGLVSLGSVALGGTWDDDYYVIQSVPAGHDLTIDVLFTHAADGDINIELYEGSGSSVCVFALTGGWTSDDNEQVVWANGTGAASDYTLLVSSSDPNFDCNQYDIQVSTAPNPCLDPLAEDSFEPSGDCVNSPTLSMGSHTGLFLTPFGNDSYSVSVPAGDELVAQVTFDPSQLQLDAYLTQPFCGASYFYVVELGLPAGPHTYTLKMTNDTGAALAVDLALFNGVETCGNYDVDLSSGPAPCLAAGIDDSFEDNDTCGSAVVLPLGFHTGLFVSKQDYDYYIVSVPAGNRVDLAFSSGSEPPVVTLYDDAACTNWVGDLSPFSDLAYVNTTGAAVNLYVEVAVFPFQQIYCETYELDVAVAPAPCLAPGLDDNMEENDDCASAVPLALGTHTGLFVSAFDHDYFTVSVPAGHDLVLDQTFTSGVDTALGIYADSACTTFPIFTSGAGGSLQLTWSNQTGAAANVVIETNVVTEFSGVFCTTYDLSVVTVPNQCLTLGLEDSFEPNQDCFTPASLPGGTHTDLFVTNLNYDWYSIDVGPGELLTIFAGFSHAAGDVDLELYSPATCGGFFNLPFMFSSTTTDDEFLQWVNTSVVTETIQLRVLIENFGDPAVTACNSYDLIVSGGEPISPFCFGDGNANVGNGPTGCPCANESPIGAGEGCLNSTGQGARLTISGFASVALDNLEITIHQARPMQPALAIQGSSLISAPFKDGLLCMGNPTERLEVMFTDASGSATTAESIAVNGHVAGGDTRYYQVWYRDPGGVSPCGTGSNFSHGLFVNWQ